MQTYYFDGHIHIGRTKENQAVKITASDQLTLHEIISFVKEAKGLDMIGIIDAHSPHVLEECFELVQDHGFRELEGGGLSDGELTILLGSEIELYDYNCSGPIHVLCYFPTLKQMKSFSNWYQSYVSNPHLSSQRIYCDAQTLQHEVKARNGLFIPAHIFTPFKSLYGKGVKTHLSEVFDSNYIDAVELGLSCDSSMANTISELRDYTFLTNSDAHSLEMIGREYQALLLEQPSFDSLRQALSENGESKVSYNYGLNPKLGKYYSSVCQSCHQQIHNPLQCEYCHSTKVLKGVPNRINEIATSQGNIVKPKRPPYVSQVPLKYIPGLGPKSLSKLRRQLHHDMYVIHDASFEEIQTVTNEQVASRIMALREGSLVITPGGGGQYGKMN
ncbi:endonuclease Q family protein [Alkalibacillus almallahensis]|uniref:endonuclease Q family protein n=1 Tax=Alkalibacillus almallahensis TaxID=1379154 RepID=UPI00141F07EF|nr:endonuclease Q family protein [Alkalibacillus almallahensis]NIK12365.1 uncharacterized protein (TIGR00375 family) [Alkalibacillus almallahensis]